MTCAFDLNRIIYIVKGRTDKNCDYNVNMVDK